MSVQFFHFFLSSLLLKRSACLPFVNPISLQSFLLYEQCFEYHLQWVETHKAAMSVPTRIHVPYTNV